jgi:hypothetical protein
VAIDELPELSTRSSSSAPSSGFSAGSNGGGGLRPQYRRGRDGRRHQRARCGSAIPERIQGQQTVGERLGHPAAPGRIETPAAKRAAEHLPLAAGGPGDERSAAPRT